ncbi:hypothetical protein AAY473_036771 [Plecturocebus cupreus]
MGKDRGPAFHSNARVKAKTTSNKGQCETHKKVTQKMTEMEVDLCLRWGKRKVLRGKEKITLNPTLNQLRHLSYFVESVDVNERKIVLFNPNPVNEKYHTESRSVARLKCSGQSRLTATSDSRVQTILLPQLPEVKVLQRHRAWVVICKPRRGASEEPTLRTP